MTRYMLDTNIVSDLIKNPQGRAARRIEKVDEASQIASWGDTDDDDRRTAELTADFAEFTLGRTEGAPGGSISATPAEW